MKVSIRCSLFGATALSAIVMMPSFALAQTAPAAAPKPACSTVPGTAATADCPAVPARAAETIVVTGSRISVNTFNSASPLTVISTGNAVLSGQIDASTILQSSTAAAGSTQINNFFSGFIVEGGPGIQTVGLNSLGAQRTLVLLNGRRLPPSGVRGQVGAVDLQAIPTLAVDNYQILNEGASPIYGSDAVGGVVNAIVRKNVNGLEVTGRLSGPTGGNGEQYVAGALWGKTADRWNVMVAAQYAEQYALKLGDRDFCQNDYVFNATTGARADFIDPATGKPQCFGVSGGQFNRLNPQGNALAGAGTWVYDASITARASGLNPSVRVLSGTPQTGSCLTATGVTVSCASQQVLLTVPNYRRLFSPQNGVIGSPVANQIDYFSPFIGVSDLISPSRRINLYATGAADLDILGGVEVYGEGLFARRESEQVRGAGFQFQVPGANPYNPFGVGTFVTSSRPFNSNQEVDTWQVLGGMRGQTGNGIGGFFKNGKWDVYGSTSQGEGQYRDTGIFADRLNASLATTITNGVASCPAPAVSGGACLPFNPFTQAFMASNFTPEQYEYLFNGVNIGNTTYRQTAFEGNVSGDLFQVPGAADAVKANVGVYYRKYDINDVPGPQSLANNIFGSTVSGITKGEDSVREVYTEVNAPLLAKKPLVESLTFVGAYRFTDYESYDTNSTWKATLDWKITPEFRFVAISGTSYRAPALFELFLGSQTGFLAQNQVDPCINHDLSTNIVLKQRCAADGIPGDYNGAGPGVTIFQVGGAGNLKEEESRSDIFSFVYTPSKIDLNMRVDAWKINVTDQVARFGAGSIVNACYTDTTGRSGNFCPLFTRNKVAGSVGAFNLLTVKDSYVNINVTEVQGIDLTVRYRKDFSFGDLFINSQHRWTTSNKSGLFSDVDLIESAGDIGDPIYVSTNQIQFRRKDWTYAWTIDAIGQSNNTTFNNGVNPVVAGPGTYYAYNGVSSVLYKTKTETTITHDFSVQYRSDNWNVVAGMGNVFDEKPPAVSTAVYFSRLGNVPLTSQYDLIGRTVFVSVTRSF